MDKCCPSATTTSNVGAVAAATAVPPGLGSTPRQVPVALATKLSPKLRMTCCPGDRKSPLEVKELGGNQEMPQVKELCVGVVGAIRDVFR
ncbi:hypothetical protein WN944_011039 [Citrus x changshan-huyou]|uniref:Uncharacterized protein n=1 Tax=Citrus x changshan-huyou TaxID=2935761 RepID=A0AAP0MXJ5_9ROSI